MLLPVCSPAASSWAWLVGMSLGQVASGFCVPALHSAGVVACSCPLRAANPSSLPYTYFECSFFSSLPVESRCRKTRYNDISDIIFFFCWKRKCVELSKISTVLTDIKQQRRGANSFIGPADPFLIWPPCEPRRIPGKPL